MTGSTHVVYVNNNLTNGDNRLYMLRKYLKQHRGEAARFARELGVSPQSVWTWSTTRVPANRVLELWMLTGKTIHPSDMRPDLYPPGKIEFSRETETKTGAETEVEDV